MFNPARLRLARRRRGLTKKALAESVSYDVKTIIRYEDGKGTPTAESISRLAHRLDFPEDFFGGPDFDEVSVHGVSFRSLKSLLVADREAALAAASLAFMLHDWVADRFNLPLPDIGSFKEDNNPESAARLVREQWGLGERRISNMMHLLESRGVRIFSLVDSTRALDAFSMWRRETPFVFVNTAVTSSTGAGQITVARSRFDLAHELGHLVLHRHGSPKGRFAEEQANQFASAFLMPTAEVLARLPRVCFLNELIQAKEIWGVSVAALNHRLHQLGITSDWQYRTFCIQIREQFRQTEPRDPPRETSLLWEKVFEALRAEHITKPKLAANVALPVAEVENLLFQLTKMQSIDGGARAPMKTRGRPSLKVVVAGEP